jgi:predicted dinucleotide-binding enzyme
VTTIGFIGSGYLGGTVARLAVAAGYDVVLSNSRGPHTLKDRSALPIAGDDPAAKAAVARLLDAIGYDTVDAGALGSGGRRFQFGTRAFVAPYGTLSDEQGTPVGMAAIRAALGV